MSSRNKNATKTDGSSRGPNRNETRLRSTILLGHSDFLFVLAKRRQPKSTYLRCFWVVLSFFSLGVKR